MRSNVQHSDWGRNWKPWNSSRSHYSPADRIWIFHMRGFVISMPHVHSPVYTRGHLCTWMDEIMTEWKLVHIYVLVSYKLTPKRLCWRFPMTVLEILLVKLIWAFFPWQLSHLFPEAVGSVVCSSLANTVSRLHLSYTDAPCTFIISQL